MLSITELYNQHNEVYNNSIPNISCPLCLVLFKKLLHVTGTRENYLIEYSLSLHPHLLPFPFFVMFCLTIVHKVTATNSSTRLYPIWKMLFATGNLDAISLIFIPIFGWLTTFINGAAVWCQPLVHFTWQRLTVKGKKNIQSNETVLRTAWLSC